jgi:hypothetical protein
MITSKERNKLKALPVKLFAACTHACMAAGEVSETIPTLVHIPRLGAGAGLTLPAANPFVLTHAGQGGRDSDRAKRIVFLFALTLLQVQGLPRLRLSFITRPLRPGQAASAPPPPCGLSVTSLSACPLPATAWPDSRETATATRAALTGRPRE